MVLTNEQRQALLAFQNFLAEDAGVFILRGYAGTGKTFLVGRMAKILQESKMGFHSPSANWKGCQSAFQRNWLSRQDYS